MATTAAREKSAALPFTPGVYFMKDEEGNILYIGKARSLRKRVRSYFLNKAQLPKIDILMSKVADIDYIQTSTEVDALLLESHLVKKYKPRYNAELKDDKSFPLIKITAEKFPRIHFTRNKSDKKAVYYGPYTDAKLLRQALALINTLFPFRKCVKLPKTACLYYHIGQCLAPCIKPEVKGEYDRIMEEVRSFLGGGKKTLIEYLTDRMMQAAEELRFEDAQFFKEQITALSELKKKRFSHKRPEGGIGLAATLQLKKTLGMEELPEKIVCFDVSNIQGDEAVASRVSFYRELPDKINYRRYKIRTVEGINDYAMIQEALSRMLAGLKEGRETFVPDIIMIDGGKGHFNAAYEVLQREGFENTRLISIAKRFETIYGLRRQDLQGPASVPESPDSGVKEAAKAEDLEVPANSPGLHLLQKVRDEAHRFAITYHRSLKEKGLERSELDAIPGIGEKRKRILLEQFSSVDELKRTGLEQLAGLPGIGRAAAGQIWRFFHE